MCRIVELSDELRMGPDSYDINIPLNKIHGLIDLIKEVNLEGKVICEIGSFLGVSTEAFALFGPLKIYAIDIWGMDENYKDLYANRKEGWADTESIFRERMKKYPNIEIIKDFSLNAVKNFDDESLDMVYIDGDHSYEAVKEDITAWLPKVKREGYICGHDYYNNVEKAVNECIDNYSTPIKTFSDTSWLFKKT